MSIYARPIVALIQIYVCSTNPMSQNHTHEKKCVKPNYDKVNKYYKCAYTINGRNVPTIKITRSLLGNMKKLDCLTTPSIHTRHEYLNEYMVRPYIFYEDGETDMTNEKYALRWIKCI